MSIKFTNFAASTIANAGGISAGDLSLNVAAGNGALFPSLAAGEYYYCVLVDTSGNREIIKVTARATDTFTIVRAQEGTIARAFALGDVVELRVTAGSLSEIRSQTEDKTADYTLTEADLRGNYTFTNAGASGTVILTLPAGSAGDKVAFVVSEAETLRIKATGADQIQYRSEVGNAAGYMESDDIGSTVKVVYDDNQNAWMVTALSGIMVLDSSGDFNFSGAFRDIQIAYPVSTTSSSINIDSDGIYKVTFRLASPSSSLALRIRFNNDGNSRYNSSFHTTGYSSSADVHSHATIRSSSLLYIASTGFAEDIAFGSLRMGKFNDDNMKFSLTGQSVAIDTADDDFHEVNFSGFYNGVVEINSFQIITATAASGVIVCERIY